LRVRGACEGMFAIRDRMRRIEDFRGLYYGKVLDWVGVLPAESLHQADGTVLRTWRENGYAITLRFDGKDCCLGVWEERDGLNSVC